MHSVKKCAWGKRNADRFPLGRQSDGAWAKRLFDSLLFLQTGNVPFVRAGSVIYELGESNFYPSGKVIANRLAIG
jgi:hypothetical protein